jgi:D-sedoheptulose 7-phosphate isomerase
MELRGGEYMNRYIKNQVQESFKVTQDIYKDKKLMTLIQRVALEMISVYKDGNKVLLAGNGGSASDAQHIAGELVSKFYFDRPGLAAISLVTDTSVLTAIGNDLGYENIFSRQISANGVQGDMFIGISTSGNSENIVKALEECRKNNIITVIFSGYDGGKMKKLCDYCICVPSRDTPRIQENHIMIGHIICAVVEEEIFGKGF